MQYCLVSKDRAKQRRDEMTIATRLLDAQLGAAMRHGGLAAAKARAYRAETLSRWRAAGGAAEVAAYVARHDSTGGHRHG